MILIPLFILVLFFSMTLSRRPRLESAVIARSTPPPRVFVQPAFSEGLRVFLDGKVKMLNVDEQSSLLLTRNHEELGNSSYLLKSKNEYHFKSTLISVTDTGRLRIYAHPVTGKKEIVFVI